MDVFGLERIIDFSIVPESMKVDHLTPITEAISQALSADHLAIAKTLVDYLIIDEHTIFGYRGLFPGTLTGILVMTPIGVETFIAIMAGRYEFAHRGNGIFLPKPQDIIPYRGAEFILVGAIGGNPDYPDDVKEIARYARGSFIIKSAWKRTINVIGLSEIDGKIDDDLKEFLKVATEDTEIPDARYRVHVTAAGPLIKSESPS